ncbi:Carboxy-terminal-processing protease [Desulfamplus magnetovallimortis]|uniref:Carboxy-terminal-processing protease n=1 Tax=Desulfamplus magnetovallimortis TaxID=1246637 RepID=A0A1W1HIT7_9BACT|nr:S41 family peptidase [Desulfamplus magnetovallimortis]SLM32325.1 Carboxy-terminal-processing protease [Desulfamplus magnetovallimortis]
MRNRKLLASMARSWLSVVITVFMVIVVGGYEQLSIAENDREKTYESLKLFTDVLQELEDNYVDEVDGEALIHSAIKGMVGSLDPHSTFMPPEAFDELQDDTKGEFGGIGIVISIKNGLLTVVSPIEGTPAYKAGIKAGDIIIKIDGESTADLALWESVKKMRGTRGESVVITIVREGVPDPVDYELVRDIIPMNSVRSATIHPGYGYLWVTNFRNNTSDEIKEKLDILESGQVPLKGLILDLRNNPGGLLSQAADVSDIFLEKGVIVSIKGRFEQHTEAFEAHKTKDDRKYPLVVLINSGSASASEIVAGALQDHKRALILGTTSFGKGSVQSVRPLRDGFGLKYTIARYYTPNGRSIQAQGIIPDIEVPFSLEEVAEKEEKELSPMERMLREKDLKNHLEPENAQKNKKKLQEEKENQDSDETTSGGLIDIEKLKRDTQVQRALDLLIGYDLFNSLD